MNGDNFLSLRPSGRANFKTDFPGIEVRDVLFKVWQKWSLQKGWKKNRRRGNRKEKKDEGGGNEEKKKTREESRREENNIHKKENEEQKRDEEMRIRKINKTKLRWNNKTLKENEQNYNINIT